MGVFVGLRFESGEGGEGLAGWGDELSRVVADAAAGYEGRVGCVELILSVKLHKVFFSLGRDEMR